MRRAGAVYSAPPCRLVLGGVLCDLLRAYHLCEPDGPSPAALTAATSTV
jgi:hypothetical protein